MNYKLKNVEKAFLIVSLINIGVICFTDINYLTYMLFMYLIVLRLTKNITNDNFLLLALFIPNKYLQLLALPIYILQVLSIRGKRLRNSEILFLVYITAVGLLNCLYYSIMPLGTLFQVAFYYCILKIISAYGEKHDHSNVLIIMDSMFPIQVLSSIIEYLRYRSLGDAIKGTLISAHYLGVYLIIYIILLIRVRPVWIRKRDIWLRIGLAAILIYLSDAKHVWAVFLAAFVVSWIMKMLHINRKVSLATLGMTVIIVGGTLFLKSSRGQSFISGIPFSQKVYVIDESFNKKYVYFNRTFEEMEGINGIFGFGVGQFGSQISITLSKGVIYWWHNDFSKYHYAIKPYKIVVNGLMTEWYTNKGIPISSMVLGYPLVSFIGLFAELGVIGYIWMLNIIDKRFRNDDPSFIIAFFTLTIFDTYLEIPCVLILTLAATYANIKTRNINCEPKGRRLV